MNFENLHKNKTLAFVDGLLCGVVLAGIGATIYKSWKETRELEKRIKEDDELEKASN